MDGAWDSPPTEAEVATAAGAAPPPRPPTGWDTPPTADELGAIAPALDASPRPGWLPAPAAGAAPPTEPEAARVADFVRWRDANTSLTPERAAEALKYSAALGHDPQWVADNLDQVKREVDASQVPWQRLWEDHPALRPFIGDPVKAAAMRDESADLPWTQKWLTGELPKQQDLEVDPFLGAQLAPGKQLRHTAEAGAIGAGVDQVALAFRKAATASPFLRDFFEPWLNIGSGRTYDPAGFKATNEKAKAELALSAERDFDTNLAGQVALAPFKMAPALLGAAAAGAAVAAAAPAEAAVAAGLAGRGLFWALQGYGELHEQLGKVEGENGQKLSPGMQQAYAGLFSLAGGVAMELGLSRITRGLGLTFEGAAGRVLSQTGSEAIANPGIARLLGRVALQGGKAVAAGSAAMAGQAALNATAMEFGKAAADPSYVTSLPDISKAAAEGFVRAIPDMLVLGFIGPTREAMRSRGEVLNAQTDAARLGAMGEAARTSKLRERFSAGFADLVDASAGENAGGAPTVFATTERFDQVARARGADPREMAAAIVGDGGAAYDKAKGTGQALEIPTGKYLTQVAVNPELERQLLPDLRLDAGGRTLREAAEQRVKDLEVMSRVMAEPVAEGDLAALQVRDHFAKMAIDSGRVTAEVAAANAENVARWYAYAAKRDRARAERAGEEPKDAWWFYRHLAPIEIAGWRDAGGVPGGVDWTTPGNAAVLARAAQGEPAARREVEQLSQGAGPERRARADGTVLLEKDLGGASAHLDATAVETLRAAGPKGEADRGSVVFTPLEGGPGVKASIHLFTGADPSTLAHETAHVFSRLLELLATRDGAADDVKADYQALLGAMGFKDAAERSAARSERADLQKRVTEAGSAEHQAVQKRLGELAAKEERFSYLWEQYLLEGKAPEAALAGPMARFKDWLIKVYKSVTGVAETYQATYGEDLGPLHPETRELFDRMLTAQDAVHDVGAGLNPLPGGTPEEASAFAGARAEAEVRLVRALVEGDRQANSEMMKAKRAELRAELAPAVDADPGQAAVRVLQAGGEGALTGPGGAPLKLDRKAATKAFGAELTRALAKEHPGIFAPKGEGLGADVAAELLGFENGKELVKRLSETRNREALLDERVQKRMQELYGAALSQDGSAVGRAALSAAANPKAAAAIIKEMARLAKDLADPAQDVRARGINWAQMVARAGAMVQTSAVGELAPGRLWASSEAAARRAFDAMQKAAQASTEHSRKAAVLRAYEERDQQLWAMAMATAAEGVKAELDQRGDQLERTAKTAWRSELGKADPALVGAHDAILEAVGIGNITPDTTGQRGTLDQALAKAAADGADIVFDVGTIRQVLAEKKPWRELTVAQATEVWNAVQNLRTIANNANEMSILGKRLQRAQVIDEMEAGVRAALPAQPRFEDDPKVRGILAKAVQGAFIAGQTVDVLLMDVATVCHVLDGGNRDGPFHRVFIDSRLACRDKRTQLTKDFLEKITGSFEKSGLDRKRLYERIDVEGSLPLPPEMGEVRQVTARTRANLLMMALNLGNDSNAERFLGGYGWDRAQVLDVLQKNLNAKEWRWVNDVWRSLEGTNGGPSLFAEMAKVHQEEAGLPPEKIQAKPFSVVSSDGQLVELDGGYFPARYDPRPTGKQAHTGEKQVQESVAGLLGFSRESFRPSSPHAQHRAEHFADVVNLDWGIVPAHVSQVIQDISHRTWARQTAALVLDSRFKNLMDARFGAERAGWFEPWLKAVVNQTSDAVPIDLRKTTTFFGGLRSKAAIASIGWSIPVALGDLTQPLTAVATGDIQARYLALATAKMRDWPAARAFVLENSKEVGERGQNINQRFRDAMAEMGGRSGDQNPWLRGMRDTAFITMEMSDRLTTTPVWLAKYHQSLAEGLTHEESARASDDTIRRVFPPEDIANKPRILRSNLSGFLLFYGYANKVWNVERQVVHDAWSTWRSEEASVGDKAGALARAAGTIAAVSLVNGVIGEYFSGRGPEQDEDRSDWLARKLIAAIFYPLPFVGALGDWAGAKAVNLATGEDRPLPQISVRQAPALSFAQDTFTRFADATKAWDEGDQDAGEVALHSAELLLGFGFGAPMRQVHKTGTAALHLLTGESPSEGAVGALGDLIYGESEQSNPLSDLSGGKQ